MTAEPADPGDAMKLAQRLREAREFANLSQQFVAEQTKLPRSAISDIERGERRVESLELKRLADIYRMPISYFLGEDTDLAGAADDPIVTALARATSAMTDHEKAEILRFALFLQRYERKDTESR